MTSNSKKSTPLDIHAILAKRKQIAIIWSVEDVLQVRPGLDESQAWKLLKRVKQQHDCNDGITWSTLSVEGLEA